MYVAHSPRSGVGAPVVGEVDGDYSYEPKKHVLEWRVSVIDASNKTGSMEFSVPGLPSDFFPIKVYFISTKSYCHVEVRVSVVGDYCVVCQCGRGLLCPVSVW